MPEYETEAWAVLIGVPGRHSTCHATQEVVVLEAPWGADTTTIQALAKGLGLSPYTEVLSVHRATRIVLKMREILSL